jgi:hypothetical protein
VLGVLGAYRQQLHMFAFDHLGQIALGANLKPGGQGPGALGGDVANLRKCAVDRLDSRFRGNDRRFESDPIPNDTSTLRRTA